MVAHLLLSFPCSSGTAVFIDLFTTGALRSVYNISEYYVSVTRTHWYAALKRQADHMIMSFVHSA
jgi:hypothetical protein